MVYINKREFAQSCSLETGLTQQQILSVLDYYTSFIKSQIKDGNEFLIPTIGNYTITLLNDSTSANIDLVSCYNNIKN